MRTERTRLLNEIDVEALGAEAIHAQRRWAEEQSANEEEEEKLRSSCACGSCGSCGACCSCCSPPRGRCTACRLCCHACLLLLLLLLGTPVARDVDYACTHMREHLKPWAKAACSSRATSIFVDLEKEVQSLHSPEDEWVTTRKVLPALSEWLPRRTTSPVPPSSEGGQQQPQPDLSFDKSKPQPDPDERVSKRRQQPQRRLQ